MEQLARLTASNQVYLAGSLMEQEDKDGQTFFHNTLYVTGPDGVVGSYRKQRLFAPMDEDRHFTAGVSPLPIATPVGQLAGLVCYDLRFPELARTQAATGANLLLVTAQWPTARLPHWRALLVARAIENQIFVVAGNRCGTTGDTTFAGHSMIVAPDGIILHEAGEAEETGSAPLNEEMLATVRNRFNTVGTTPYPMPDQDKIQTLQALIDLAPRLRQTGRRIVFTNGCFDILHPGHVTYLEQARRMGDCLIVGLNSDTSVRGLKGPSRPVNCEEDRARLLASLGCVDYVVLFAEPTPLALIKAIMPDILVKGGDWPVEAIVGGAEVLAAGGKVISIPLLGKHSTTALLDRVRQGE
jgi:rfaE bifunctional protein nucleotidyltransferase chain/domain